MINIIRNKCCGILFGFYVMVFCAHAFGVANEGLGLGENEYQAFLQYAKEAPGNLSKDRETLSKLSNQQLEGLVESFNVSPFQFLQPVKIPGRKIAVALDRKFDELSVMAVWGGELKPIPFQFDEYDNKSRYIYIPDVNPTPLDGTYLQLDPNDDLIFLYRDASEYRYSEGEMSPPEGRILKELKFTDRKGRSRYAYLVEHNSQRSDVDYVNAILGKKDAKIDTSFFNLDFNPENFLDFRDLSNNVGEAAHRPIMDQIFFEVSANIFSEFIKVGLNSFDNVRVKVLDVKDGPVRATVFAKIYIVLAGIPLFGMNSEISFYEQGLVFPNRTEVGKGAALVNLVKNPRILFYCDLNVEGGQLTAQVFKRADGSQIYAVVDGEIDSEEAQAMEATLPGDWVWVQSPKGWEVVSTFKLSGVVFDGMESTLYYKDSPSILTEHEKYPGANPHIGMLLKGLPNDMAGLEKLDMEYAFWFTGPVGEDGPGEFYLDEQNQAALRVSDLPTSRVATLE